MYVYTGTLTYLDPAKDELFILIFPRSFAPGDPALAYWHWTVSEGGERNQPTSLRGRIDSVTTSPSSNVTSLRLFQNSFHNLTVLLPNPQPPATLLMTFSNQDGSHTSDVQSLKLGCADDDALDICRVYVGTLDYFDYALSAPIVFVLPRGKWGRGEKIGVYWQWTVDAAGRRKVVSDHEGSVDWATVEEEGKRRVELLGESYYSFVGEVSEQGAGEMISFTLWNRSRTDKGSVIGKLLYAGVGAKPPALVSDLPFTPAASFSSTPASTSSSPPTSVSTSSSTSRRSLSTIDPFHLITVFNSHSVTHPSPEHPPSLRHPSTPQHFQAGTWTNTRTIGSGGFGIVTLQTCHDRGGELRAVKRLQLGMGKIDYNRELKALAALSDRADIFVNFLGWYRSTDFVYIAMEYLPHGDLAQYIQNRPAEASTNARSLTIQLLRGLDILHKRNICHRDLKPPHSMCIPTRQNVLLVSLDPIRVKITDFGISKQMAGTQLRTLCGTSGYIAPEITGFVPRSSGDYTGAVDMWALGTILHEMLVGVIPFAQEEGAEEDDYDEEEEDGDDEVMMESESAVRVMQVDIHMLNNYCSGLTPFPEELLAEKGVGRETREVVKGLLVPQPTWRWGVERVLASSWLKGGESSG